jgi:hypothetical protein
MNTPQFTAEMSLGRISTSLMRAERARAAQQIVSGLRPAFSNPVACLACILIACAGAVECDACSALLEAPPLAIGCFVGCCGIADLATCTAACV